MLPGVCVERAHQSLCADFAPVPSAGMVLETIAKCDVDIRKELYGGVILTGGTALLTGVRTGP